MLGTPMFSKATVRMGKGSSLEISAKGEGVFVQSVKLNGKPYDRTWLPVDSLSAKQNQLVFELGKEPDRAWGADPGSFPPSFDSLPK